MGEILGSIFGGLLGGAGSIVGGALQAKYAKKALELQEKMFDIVRADLKPYIGAGKDATNLLMDALPGLTERFDPTMEELEATPGYQFTLNQGLKAAQNGFAARGLASSGAAMKGAASYASGLASQTYQQQLQNHMAQNLQHYNMLMGPMQVGAGAAAGQAGVGGQFAGNMGQYAQNIGTAWSAGINGAANSINNGLQAAYGWGYGGSLL
jgi:hypothetical protein